MTLDRRRFLTVSAASITGSILAACDKNPKSAQPLLNLAERANQRVEEGLFRHTAMNRLDANTPVAGRSFPKYFVSPRVPVWDPAANGVWRLEVSGAVRLVGGVTRLRDLAPQSRARQIARDTRRRHESPSASPALGPVA